jgi:hypothetical protein
MSKVRFIFVSALAVVAVSAVAVASASAVMPAYNISSLLSVESTKLTAANAVLEGTLAGVTIKIECATEKGSGEIENSAVTGVGLSIFIFHYTSCVVAAPAGQNCLISNRLILFVYHDALSLHGGSGFFLDRFGPATGTTITTINIDNCTTTALNGAFNVTGTAGALVNNANSGLEFTATSGSALKFGGNPIIYRDAALVLMTGGGAITVINEKS